MERVGWQSHCQCILYITEASMLALQHRRQGTPKLHPERHVKAA